MKRFALPWTTLLLLAALVALPTAPRAQILAGITLEKLGLLDLPGTGARPLAMGGAYTAAGNDVFALLYNPACLTEMQRQEITIGLHQRFDDITNEYTSDVSLSADQSTSSTSLGHLAGAYPYPTYRGSLVFGFGIFQVGNARLETVKNAHLADIPATVANEYVQTGTIYQLQMGVGVDVSPSVALGAGLAIWTSGIDFTDEIDYADNDSSAYWIDDVELDLDGVSFNAGMLIRFTENLRGGFSFTSPAWLSLDGDGVTQYYGDYAGGGGWTTDDEWGVIEDDYTLPMRWTGGLALTLPNVTLGADLAWTDYSQTKYNDLTITSEIDPGKEHVLDAAWELRLGGEVALPMAPVYLRAGYRYAPFALSSVEEVAYIVEDAPTSVIAEFEAQKERQFFTFGAGAVIDRVLALDAAVVIGGYERSTSAGGATVLDEKRDITEIVVSGTYRF